jgi:DNA polymerase I-like protein with 3'-5' exonuclease and polymerase domains
LAADVAKAAMYECSRACYTGRDSSGRRYPALYGSYIVNFVHDEGIFEFPIDRAHEAAMEATEIMNRTSQEWMPNCPSKVEPCLMLEWAKDAAPKFDKQTGKLIPWIAPVKEAA